MSDKSGRPISGATVKLADHTAKLVTVRTDMTGAFELNVPAGEYHVSLSRHGFSPVNNHLMIIHEGLNRLRFRLLPMANQFGLMNLAATPEAGGFSQASKKIQAVEDSREQTPDVSQVLLDRYGEIRTPGSQGSSSKYLVDAPGQARPQDFGLMNNLETNSVQSLEIRSKSALGSDYSSPATGLAPTTRPPGERWGIGVAAIAPSVRIQRGVRFGDWHPEISVQGPLPDHRFWFSNTVAADHNLIVIPELPRSADSITSWQASDRIATLFAFSPQHVLSVNLLGSWQDDSHIGLSPLMPAETTVSLASKRGRFSVNDQHIVNDWMFDYGFSLEYRHATLAPQGGGIYILHPGFASGAYFETLRGDTAQGTVSANLRFPEWRFLGHHETQLGAELTPTTFHHHAQRSPFEIVGPDGSLEQITDFVGNSNFTLHNRRTGGYLQDSWTLLPNLRIQLGSRFDRDSLISANGWGPRASIAYLPFSSRKTKLFAFSGVYYPPLNLALLGQAEDQLRIDRFFDNGVPIAPPQTADFVATPPRLHAPHYISSRAGIEQQIGESTFVSGSILERNQRDVLAYQKLASKKNLELLPLANTRKDNYHAYEFSIRHSFGTSAEVMASYTRSHTHTNQLFDYDLDAQAFTNQYQGPLEYDAPNRVVSWGWGPIVRDSVLLSYLLEYRTGFPFTVFDQDYQVVGQPNQLRFPDYFRLNLGVEKILKFQARKFGVRLSVNNITGHRNFIAVDNNITSPTFLRFAGALGRSYNIRVRLLGGSE